MSEPLGEILGVTEKSHLDDISRVSPVPLPTSRLVRVIHNEHNYNFILPDILPENKLYLQPNRTLRQLVCAMHDKINPGQLGQLSVAKMEEHIRKADLIQRRLRRFLASDRRFIDFSPMSSMHEAIVEQLAEEMHCPTRFYATQDGSRYLVVYQPGIGPNRFELTARQGVSGRKVELYSPEVEEKQIRMSSGGQNPSWHQKTQQEDLQMAEFSVRLGRNILDKFNASSQQIRHSLRPKRKSKENIKS
ncbi:uncharacterized protein LOC108048599 [Drosophila rhopaloa]|uniref:Uncharacterized protein LOC108048599 n=1 Tax=Drosophila rhopaloa TaxID=1041015 RepID=A0A6P4F396_DRORH|nr:uncharacterized protein LOC108048599 [Drosophila rhopaloa]